VCDWGEVGKLGEDNPSPCGFVIEQKIKNQQLDGGSIKSMIPMKKEDPSNLFNE
jgi:hypothetical protein